jgi:plastocyanin
MTIRRTTLVLTVGLVALGGCGDDDVADGDVAADDTVTIRAVAPAPFEDAPSTVPSGEVTLRLVNEDEMGHSLQIEELGDGVGVIDGGDEGTAQLEFEPGTTYTYFCDVPGHRDLGMEGQFEAEG